MRLLKRHLRRPRPASIAATVAFFLAVGGVGYAVTGSGTLQKENEVGIPVGTNIEAIRSVAGVGLVSAGNCVAGDGEVVFNNTSGETLVARADQGNALQTQTLTNGSGVGVPFTEDEILQFHVFPDDGSKSPQADITVSVDHTGNCATTQVAVINVTTTTASSGTVAGSGTVQKGVRKNLPPLGERFRSVTGVGDLYARCNDAGASDVPLVDFVNTSGETLRLFADELGSSASFTPHEIGDDGLETFAGNGDTVLRFYVFPADGSKTPQADITLSFVDTNECATSAVGVLAVTTQQ